MLVSSKSLLVHQACSETYYVSNPIGQTPTPLGGDQLVSRVRTL